ncbi:thiosulfate reductase cytochrome b subunit [Desulfobaculum xiamenense]|uniref:Thiosulfate reductase cytochrome b subunit n=1 Tax=Desulfobaculum xiamenense TaxID=995050 RepID=A0A846QMD7_9BACT|nr:thiosulfate reductase cytochrome B subunit [Desulfobaculum xiamenense]NJB68347.1 thiosulfate reductase cytochrome b subunit [Desulfobaculum xiamenense]
MRRIAAGVLSLLLFCLLAAAPLSAATPVPAAEANAACLKCHGDPDLSARTERGAALDLYVPAERLARSTHRGLACTDCHEGAGTTEDFAHAPHKLSASGTKDCADCHARYFGDISASFAASRHVEKLGDKFSCSSCHDAHTTEARSATRTDAEQVRFDNYTCLRCHTDLSGYKALSGREVWEQNLSHDFLPNKDRHFAAVRCVECHTPVEGTDVHRILPKDKSLRDCTACHRAGSALVARTRTDMADDDVAGMFLGKGLFDDETLVAKLLATESGPAAKRAEVDANGFINSGLFADSYVIGATRNVIIDGWSLKLGLAVLAGVLLHGCLRFAMRRRRAAGPEHSEYVYDLHVRVWHWINAALFVVLVATGFSMHFAGLPGTIGFAVSVHAHDIAGWLLVANYGVFVLMALATGNIRQYIPNPRGMIVRWAVQARFYLWGIFRGEAHPYRVTRSQRFNPLQQAAYLPIMYLMMPLLILSGVWMFFPELTPETVFGYPGMWLTASVHNILAVGFAIFLVAHVYLSTTGDKVLSLVKGMFTGYHVTREHHDTDER